VPTQNTLSTFFHAVSKASESRNLDELTDDFVSLAKSRNENANNPQIQKVLELVSQHYNIPVRTLTQNTGRGKFRTARHLCYVILNLEVGLPSRYIARRIFNRAPNCVNRAMIYYKQLNPKIKDDADFIASYELIKSKL
jgi:chromosomal replication initiation ATPase DnaA